MISRELNKLEHMAEKQNILQIKEEERGHWDHILRKLSLPSYPKVKEMSITAGHQKLHQGQKRPSHHLYSSVNIPEETSPSLSSPHDVQSNTTEQKKLQVLHFKLQVTYADVNGEKAKKSSLNYESAKH
ncbi:hypothetical protein EI555_004821 [Monodon monoceros]|uniref:Uncharacterized protein n=1 Tax=Monodon monoceros TaxID=40151 RepID=A0A4U1EUS0_MONMO|nr:hypothetical protein EI555_004821 [Monodon monoceros]